jgi:CPA2 family monovalent cation:H+ antiporter-2
MAAVTLLLGAFSGLALRQAFFLGFLVALSSTAIVLRLLEDRGESFTVHGRLMLGVLIFQDLAVVPLMLLTLLLGHGGAGGWGDAGLTLLESAGFIAGLLVIARFLYPWLMEQVVRTRSREIFILTTMLVALGTAWLGSRFGFSLPLGAFLAGIVISESEYSNQILAEITPLTDIFNSIFFVSVGMLVAPSLWAGDPLLFAGLTLGVLVLKALIVGAVALTSGFGTRVSLLAGIGLAQVGEFSFVLASVGLDQGLMDDELFSQFLTVSVVTMALTPLLVLLAAAAAARVPHGAWMERLAAGKVTGGAEAESRAGSAGRTGRVGRARRLRFLRDSIIAQGPVGGEAEDHVVIVGYGINGRNVARVLRQIDVRYIVLELNPHTVREGRELGEEIYYGDAARAEVLRHAGIERARALIVAIADPVLSRQIVTLSRQASASLKIIARTRFVGEADELYRLGADEVVPEEFETSLELAGMVMAAYGASERVIEKEKAAIRSERYALLCREECPPVRPRMLTALLSAEDLEHLELTEGLPVVGGSIADTRLRTLTGATIIAIEREGRLVMNPAPEFQLAAGDMLFLFGRAEELEAARGELLGRLS